MTAATRHPARTHRSAHPCAARCRLWDAVDMAWLAGRDYERDRLAEAIDDIRHAPAISPARTYEQRIAERLAEAAACAARLHARIGTREWRGLEHGDQVTPW